MTTRFATLTVALSTDLRDDDAQSLIDAIKMLRGVADVKGDVSDPGQWLAETRVRSEICERLLAAVFQKP